MYILLALPIVTALGVSVTQPGYVDELFGHPVGRLMIVAGIGFMTAGGLWIRRISRLVF
jgi:tight adherence protein B